MEMQPIKYFLCTTDSFAFPFFQDQEFILLQLSLFCYIWGLCYQLGNVRVIIQKQLLQKSVSPNNDKKEPPKKQYK